MNRSYPYQHVALPTPHTAPTPRLRHRTEWRTVRFPSTPTPGTVPAMSEQTDGPAIARQRIAEEAEAQTGFLDLGMLGLTELPEELFRLKHLRRLNLGSAILDNDGFLRASSADLAPNVLATSLDRLRDLPELEELFVSSTKLPSLNGIGGLTGLRRLDCSDTPVSSLGPLAGLAALLELDCSNTRVSDLRPLTGLAELQSLRCYLTDVEDLDPLDQLAKLRLLLCSRTYVNCLNPLARLPSLKYLDFSHTRVSSIQPLTALEKMEWTHCSHTQVRDLGPLAGLAALRELDCSGCDLSDFPERLLFSPSLEELFLYDCRLPGVPAEVLSQSGGANCLHSLRAHVRDLAAGAVAVADVKLMVLGNGRVGKTQLCRRLRGEPFDETVASTHGITVTAVDLPAAGDGPAVRLNLWDFGGQDLYHGTHALFLRSNAIFLLVWTPEFEESGEHEHGGMRFRNHPLAYWVDYVRHLGGRNSPVLVVQTRCDRPEDEAACPVPETTLFKAFEFHKPIRFSARTGRGRAALAEALADAAQWLRAREGIATIGAGRHRVKTRLEEMRNEDAKAPPDRKRYRTMTQARFREICDEAGGVGAPEHLLAYLHNAGIVFYQPGLFQDDIILDQGWALDAIYAVFHREKCYSLIKRLKGRFTRADLADWVWGGHSVAEQELFLGMMKSCGICFVHRRLGPGDAAEIEYIAPDLLPDRADIQADLDQKWDADQPTETAAFAYKFLHFGVIRSVISRIGRQAGLAAEYWQGGVYFSEAETSSRAIIEQEMNDDWRGIIRIQTQRGQSAALLTRLSALVEKENERAGLKPEKVTTTTSIREQDVQAPGNVEPPSPTREWCVSYAWGDDTPEGKKREAIVDAFCAAAAKKDIQILRDKTALGLGERISKFMQRIGRGDRVFIFLSDRYLKSPSCMYELHEIWRNNQQDSEKFRRNTRFYPLGCAKIWSIHDRLDYAEFWRSEYQSLKTRIQGPSFDSVSTESFEQHKRMRIFSEHVDQILANVADILQPRSFDELMTYGFAGLPSCQRPAPGAVTNRDIP